MSILFELLPSGHVLSDRSGQSYCTFNDHSLAYYTKWFKPYGLSITKDMPLSDFHAACCIIQRAEDIRVSSRMKSYTPDTPLLAEDIEYLARVTLMTLLSESVADRPTKPAQAFRLIKSS